jgi:hypothetical protein
MFLVLFMFNSSDQTVYMAGLSKGYYQILHHKFMNNVKTTTHHKPNVFQVRHPFTKNL